MTNSIFNLTRKTKVQAIRVKADNKWADALIIKVSEDRVTGYPLSQLAMQHLMSGADIDQTIDQVNAFMNERAEALGMSMEEITISKDEADKDQNFQEALKNGDITIEEYTLGGFLKEIVQATLSM